MSGAEDRTSASALGVLFLGAALLTVVAISVILAKPSSAEIDGVEAMNASFGGVPNTWASDGLSSAVRTPTGEEVITFDGPFEGGVEQLVLTIVPLERASDVLDDQFRSLRFEKADARGGRRGGGGSGRGGGGWGDKDSGPSLQDISTFDWNGYDASYARMRHGKGTPADEDAFYEVVRVNLSVGQRCAIAYVRFPEREVADVDAVRSLLAQLGSP